MDLFAFVGATAGQGVLTLARLLLDAGLLRFFDARGRTGVQDVLQFLDGSVARTLSLSNVLSPRFAVYGEDAIDKLLRAPLLLEPGPLQEFALAFLAQLSQLRPEAGQEKATAERRFFILLTDKNRQCAADEAATIRMEHIQNDLPQDLRRLLGTNDSCKAHFLSREEKLVFMLLFILTKQLRLQFAREATYALLPPPPAAAGGAGSSVTAWMQKDVLLKSARLTLHSFLKWLCYGPDLGTQQAMTTSARFFLPVSEDNNVISAHLGRMFDTLISTEIVFLSEYQAAVTMATVKEKPGIFPKIETENVPYIIMAISYMYWRMLRWKVLEARDDPNKAGSFGYFLRIALEFTFPGACCVQLPPGLVAYEFVFEELKGVILTGYLESRKCKLLIAYHRHPAAQTDGKNLSMRRLLISIIQIANVLRKRLRKSETNAYEVKDVPWVPVRTQYISHELLVTLEPYFEENWTVIPDATALLVPTVNSNMLKQILDPLQYVAHTNFRNPYRVEVNAVDVVHPVHTQMDVACLLVFNSEMLTVGLPAVRSLCTTFAHAYRTDRKRPDPRARLDFISSLLRGGPNLFHWLYAFRFAVDGIKADTKLSELVARYDLIAPHIPGLLEELITGNKVVDLEAFLQHLQCTLFERIVISREALSHLLHSFSLKDAQSAWALVIDCFPISQRHSLKNKRFEKRLLLSECDRWPVYFEKLAVQNKQEQQKHWFPDYTPPLNFPALQLILQCIFQQRASERLRLYLLLKPSVAAADDDILRQKMPFFIDRSTLSTLNRDTVKLVNNESRLPLAPRAGAPKKTVSDAVIQAVCNRFRFLIPANDKQASVTCSAVYHGELMLYRDEAQYEDLVVPVNLQQNMYSSPTIAAACNQVKIALQRTPEFAVNFIQGANSQRRVVDEAPRSSKPDKRKYEDSSTVAVTIAEEQQPPLKKPALKREEPKEEKKQDSGEYDFTAAMDEFPEASDGHDAPIPKQKSRVLRSSPHPNNEYSPTRGIEEPYSSTTPTYQPEEPEAYNPTSPKADPGWYT